MGFLDKMRVGVPQTATDPVCHMQVDPNRAAGKTEHAGVTYHFCSAGCKRKFEAEPAKFVGPGGAGGAHHMH